MKKRTLFVVSASVIVLLAAGASLYFATRTVANVPHYWAKAERARATESCLSANPKLTVSKNARNDIEMSALTYLVDVPAGTNVDVKLATYTGTTATGSDHYPAKYGNYNFAMTKQSDGWNITEFKRCH